MQQVSSANKQFPCPGCGSTLEFNPKQGQMVCPYCGYEKGIAHSQTSVVEQSYDAFLTANHTQLAALSTTAVEVKCSGCSAQFTFEPSTVAGKCPFCSTSIVNQPHSASPVVTPKAILPFQLNQQAARETVQKWLGNRWFAPDGLKNLAQQESIQGIYLPFWTYDCQTVSRYRGERGTHYTKTETYTETNSDGKQETKTREVQHTRWTSVSGHVSRFFDDVLVPGTQAVSGQNLDALAPWSLAGLVSYDPSYLSGFKAQRYQVNLKEGFEQAKGQMTCQIKQDVEQDIGGDEQRVHNISTAYSDITFKHILLPVWATSYRFKNRQYQVLVNAQTGKVVGDRPYSAVKITLVVVGVAATIAAVFGVQAVWQNPPRSPSVPSIEHTRPGQSESTVPSAPPPASIPSQPSTDETFRQAVNLANSAVSKAKTAQTRQDWQQIASQWEQAIVLMTQVPPSSPNYATAQSKAVEYQQYLNYARQKVQ